MKRTKTGRIMTAEQVPRLWTGDRLLDHALTVAGLSEADLRTTMQRHREALDAVLPEKRTWERSKKSGRLVLSKREEGGAPDWPTRLRAGETLFAWLGFRGKREHDSGPAQVAAIHVHLHAGDGSSNGSGPRAALPGGRVRVHLEGHHGGPGP